MTSVLIAYIDESYDQKFRVGYLVVAVIGRGAFLHEATGEKVRQYSSEPSWLSETKAAQEQRELLAGLLSSQRYGIVSIECS